MPYSENIKQHYSVSKCSCYDLCASFFGLPGLIKRFYGNRTERDYFKLLDVGEGGESSVLIGARNIGYNLSLPDLEENVNQVLTSSHL